MYPVSIRVKNALGIYVSKTINSYTDSELLDRGIMISSTAKIGDNAKIANGVRIERLAIIQNDAEIPNDNTRIRERTLVKSNGTFYHPPPKPIEKKKEQIKLTAFQQIWGNRKSSSFANSI